MTTYRIMITGSKWPVEFTVQASGWAAAIGRAIREWKKKQKGSRTDELKIRAIKQGKLLTEDNRKEQSDD